MGKEWRVGVPLSTGEGPVEGAVPHPKMNSLL